MNGYHGQAMLDVAPTANLSISTSLKKCTKCGLPKKIDEYYEKRSEGRLIGIRSECKMCFNEKRRGRKFSNVSIFKLYRHNAQRKGLLFDVTFQQFSEFLYKPCIYCGDIARGIDRKDNAVGYTIENMGTCCIKCNQMKSKMHQKDFIEHCNKIAKLAML